MRDVPNCLLPIPFLYSLPLCLSFPNCNMGIIMLNQFLGCCAVYLIRCTKGGGGHSFPHLLLPTEELGTICTTHCRDCRPDSPGGLLVTPEQRRERMRSKQVHGSRASWMCWGEHASLPPLKDGAAHKPQGSTVPFRIVGLHSIRNQSNVLKAQLGP